MNNRKELPLISHPIKGLNLNNTQSNTQQPLVLPNQHKQLATNLLEGGTQQSMIPQNLINPNVVANNSATQQQPTSNVESISVPNFNNINKLSIGGSKIYSGLDEKHINLLKNKGIVNDNEIVKNDDGTYSIVKQQNFLDKNLDKIKLGVGLASNTFGMYQSFLTQKTYRANLREQTKSLKQKREQSKAEYDRLNRMRDAIKKKFSS